MKLTLPLLLFTFVLITKLDANPLARKQLDTFMRSNPCVANCFDKVDESGFELSILKSTDYVDYILNLPEICRVISEARECITDCGITSNPYALPSTTVVCSQDILQEAKKHTKCLMEHGMNATITCKHRCGDLESTSEEIRTQTDRLNSNPNPSRRQYDYIMQLTGDACEMTKCFAQCNRAVLSSICSGTYAWNAGDFLHIFLQRVNEALVDDMEAKSLRESMSKWVPPQCSYMYTKGVLFTPSTDQKTHSDDHESPITPENNEYQMAFELAELQRKLLLEELRLMRERESLIAKETRKVDMELKLVKNKENI
ncbi:hypothetical protein AB6A40_003406 [Gnathostoma spinigerum]|uniref:Uncharacterized protein n=1 Tax=Gnathostoma spinigerum TaxID=75299 RepID=A0ABD6EJ44_9BILA